MDKQTLEETTTEIYCETRCSKYFFTDDYPSTCEECIFEPEIRYIKNDFYTTVSEEIKKTKISLENLRKRDIKEIIRKIEKRELKRMLK